MKKHLKTIGIWQEESKDLAHPLLEDAINTASSATVNVGVINYLTEASLLSVSPGVVKCNYCEGKIIGTGSLHTDGNYVWADTLAHYVTEHGVELPIDFTKHIKSASFIAPQLSNETLIELANDFLNEQE